MAASMASPTIRVLVIGIMLWMVALPSFVEPRAVNISNTWVLPEDGFPVFYRYFRDRITWFEADAVCQFHHANLVTVDDGAQFDAARAFLKELDVVSPVWVGLRRERTEKSFRWTNAQPLRSMGYWNEPLPPPQAVEELCAATNPAADFRWNGLNCGGPEVASFICELPVPSWATARDGCLVESIPSLTVTFLPEQAAVELTSDCGMGGTKKVACKGNTTREALYNQLNCHNIMGDQTDGPDGTTSASSSSESDDPVAVETVTVSVYSSTTYSTIEKDSTTPLATTTSDLTSTRLRRDTPIIDTTTMMSSSRSAASSRKLSPTPEAGDDAQTTVTSPESASQKGAQPESSSTVQASAAPTPTSTQRTIEPAASFTPMETVPIKVKSPLTTEQTTESRLVVSNTPQKVEQIDTLILVPKQNAATKEIVTNPGLSKEQPQQWKPDDKAIIIPVVAKKGPQFPPKKVAHKSDKQIEQTPSPSTLTPPALPISPVTAKDIKVDVVQDNKLDGNDYNNNIAPEASDDGDEDLLIRELSNADTPLSNVGQMPVLYVPLEETRSKPPVKKDLERSVDLHLPEHSVFKSKPQKSGEIPLDLHLRDYGEFKSKPVKKDGLPAAIAGAAVITTQASATVVSTVASTSSVVPRLPPVAGSTASPARLRESMAGPGGKARTLTTTTIASAEKEETTVSEIAPITSTSSAPISSSAARITTTTSVPTTRAVTTIPAEPSTTITSSTSNLNSSAYDVVVVHTDPMATTESTPKENKENRRRQHLPAPLLSMNMKPDGEEGFDALEPEPPAPPAPPRPNRGRSLVRQQHRSFYFFNRVLGR